ncbi:MAG TPA: hypothetical protein VK977_05960 [Actinomycetota bacterium]|nr:hypothetical protein [Actinomycetota bacterium]
MGPVVSHIPCDLNQQRMRYEARMDRVSRVVARANGHRSVFDRILGRTPRATELSAEDLRDCEPAEDVFHSFRF